MIKLHNSDHTNFKDNKLIKANFKQLDTDKIILISQIN